MYKELLWTRKVNKSPDDSSHAGSYYKFYGSRTMSEVVTSGKTGRSRFHPRRIAALLFSVSYMFVAKVMKDIGSGSLILYVSFIDNAEE